MLQCMKDFILIAMKCENSCDRTKKCIKKAGRQVPCQVCQNVCPKRFLYTISTYGIKIFVKNRFSEFEINSLQVEVSFHFVFQSPVAHQKHNYVVEYRSEENDEVYYCFGAINSQI